MPAVGTRELRELVAFLLGAATIALPRPSMATDPQITVGRVAGKPGERLTLPVEFDPGTFEVTTLGHELFFAPYTTVAAHGFVRRPDCWAESDPGRTPSFSFLPLGCGGGASCAGILFYLLISHENESIGKGTAYTCPVIVSDDAPPGRYPVACHRPIAGHQDRSGASVSVPVQCVDGEVTVVTCLGDCSLNNKVTVHELLAGVNLALGVPEAEDCAVAWDVDRDGEVRITDLIQGVNNALDGCGTAR